jgi:hypothetical protein
MTTDERNQTRLESLRGGLWVLGLSSAAIGDSKTLKEPEPQASRSMNENMRLRDVTSMKLVRRRLRVTATTFRGVSPAPVL